MGAFDQIRGQKRAVAHLQRAILTDHISHAYLLTGQSSDMLLQIAKAFAMTLMCTGRDKSQADACMTCTDCRKALGNNHPDILVWTHEKPKTFSVDDARRLVDDISIRPYEGDRKIYLVPDAHLMNAAAQNALLKTLEEPPEYAVILLLSESADVLLDTIRSRCVCIELAQGEMEYPDQIREAALQILSHLDGWKTCEIQEYVHQLAPIKLQIGYLLDFLRTFFRDVLFLKSTGDPEGVLLTCQLDEITKVSGRMSYGQIRDALTAIAQAQSRLQSNVNFDVTMELLLLSIRDCM